MIYLDHAALTPVAPAALDAMAAAAREAWGHPGSVHAAGRRARAALDHARIHVAAYLGCAPAELRWTASGSEALRVALEHALRATTGPVVTSALEHPAVLGVVEAAERRGRAVRRVPMPAGELRPDALARALEGAAVVALSAMNQELGTAPDLAPWLDRAPAAWWVIDAVQAAAWRDLTTLFHPRAFVAVSGHKLGAPPGVGALRLPPALAYPRSGARDEPVALPAGAPPWLAAIGLGAACEARRGGRDAALARARALGEALLAGLREAAPGVAHNAGAGWVGTVVNVSAPGFAARALESALDLRGVCVARTSACRQTVDGDSPVVAAAWEDEPWRAASATRWSLGADTTAREITEALDAWRAVVRA